MCCVGDIILIQNYKSGNSIVGQHSFVVVSDEPGIIKSAPFDLVGNVMSSFKDDEQKQRKLSYGTNFPISFKDSDVVGNKKDGYIKADQLYYFDKSITPYKKLGSLSSETLDALLRFIETSDFQIVDIVDNLISNKGDIEGM